MFGFGKSKEHKVYLTEQEMRELTKNMSRKELKEFNKRQERAEMEEWEDHMAEMIAFWGD